MINHIITFVILPFLHFDATNLKAYQLQTAVDSRETPTRYVPSGRRISRPMVMGAMGLRRRTGHGDPDKHHKECFGQKLSEFNVLNIISPLAQTHILEYVIRCLTSEQLHSLDARRGAKLFTFDISKIGATAWGSQAAKSNGPMANDSNVFCHEPLLTPYSLGFLGGWVRPSADVESRWAHYASSFPGPIGPVQ